MPENNSPYDEFDPTKHPGKGSGYDPNDYTHAPQLPGQIDQAYQAAQSKAEEMCDDGDCCKVIINIDCDDIAKTADGSDPKGEFADRNKPGGSGDAKPKCGEHVFKCD